MNPEVNQTRQASDTNNKSANQNIRFINCKQDQNQYQPVQQPSTTEKFQDLYEEFKDEPNGTETSETQTLKSLETKTVTKVTARKKRLDKIKYIIYDYPEFIKYIEDRAKLSDEQFNTTEEQSLFKEICDRMIDEIPNFETKGKNEMRKDLDLIIKGERQTQQIIDQSNLLNQLDPNSQTSSNHLQHIQVDYFDSLFNNGNELLQIDILTDSADQQTQASPEQVANSGSILSQNTEEEFFRFMDEQRLRQTFTLESDFQTQIEMLRPPTQEQLNQVANANKELLNKEKQKYGQSTEENTYSLIKRKTLVLQSLFRGGCILKAGSLFLASASASHAFFFVIDIFVIWDLKRKNLITDGKLIKVIAAKLGQHMLSMVGFFAAGSIGALIGSLVCPGLGTLIGGLIGIITGPLAVDIICEKYIFEYIQKDVQRLKPLSYYLRALKKLEFSKPKLKKYNMITDDDIQYHTSRLLSIYYHPRETNKKKAQRNAKKLIEIIVAREVIKRYRMPDQADQEFQEVISTYQNQEEDSPEILESNNDLIQVERNNQPIV